jgi:hypothetical protein
MAGLLPALMMARFLSGFTNTANLLIASTACAPNLHHHAVRYLRRRSWHSLHRGSDGQCKGKCHQSNHLSLQHHENSCQLKQGEAALLESEPT